MENIYTHRVLNPRYTVGTVAELTGLTQHTIRAWERRYGALTPVRSGSNRRLYGYADVQRLKMLDRLVKRGHTIGQIANLSDDQLASMNGEPLLESRSISSTGLESEGDASLHLARRALRELDASGLEEALSRAAARLGVIDLLHHVVTPLLQEIERQWVEKELSIYHEHFATAVIRTYLERTRLSLPAPPNSPRLLVTTPRHQNHELGALMVGLVAAVRSWNVTYLGPNLPANEIVRAAQHLSADAIGISLVFPLDDKILEEELRHLRRSLKPNYPILVGGRGVHAYERTLKEIDAIVIEDFDAFQELLDNIAAT